MTLNTRHRLRLGTAILPAGLVTSAAAHELDTSACKSASSRCRRWLRATALAVAAAAAATGTARAQKAPLPPMETSVEAQAKALDAGRLDEALRGADALLRRQPDHAAALAVRGAALQGMGRLDEALEAFHASLAVNPVQKLATRGACRVRLLLRMDNVRPACFNAIVAGGWLWPDFLNYAHAAAIDDREDPARLWYLQTARSFEDREAFEQSVLGDFDLVFKGHPKAEAAAERQRWLKAQWQAVNDAKATLLRSIALDVDKDPEVKLPTMRGAIETFFAAGWPSNDAPKTHGRGINLFVLNHYFLLLEKTNRHEEMLNVARRMLGQHISWDLERNRLHEAEAVALAGMGRTQGAIDAYRNAIAQQEKSAKSSLPHIVSHLVSVAQLQLDDGEVPAARLTLDQAAQLIEQMQADDARAKAATVNFMLQAIRLLMSTGEMPLAKPLLERLAKDIQDAAVTPGLRGQGLARLAQARTLAGQHGEALALHRESAAMLRDSLGGQHQATLEQGAAQASALAAAGRQREAVAALERIVQLSDQHLGEDHPAARERRARLREWRAEGTAGMVVAPAAPATGEPALPASSRERGEALLATNQPAEAQAAFEAALAAAPKDTAAARGACRAALLRDAKADARPAQAACARALALGGGQSRDVLNAGHSLALAGDTDGARRHYQQVARTIVAQDAFQQDVLDSFDAVFAQAAHQALGAELRAWTRTRWAAVAQARADHAEAKRLIEARRMADALAPAERAYLALEAAGPLATDVAAVDGLINLMALQDYLHALEQNFRFEDLLQFADSRLASGVTYPQDTRDLLLSTKASALEWLGREPQAIAAYQAAIAVIRSDAKPDAFMLHSNFAAIARLHLDLGQPTDAARALDQAATALEQIDALSRVSAETEYLLQRARWAVAEGQPAQAAQFAEQAMALGRKRDDPGFVALGASALAEARSAQGQHEAALSLHAEALAALQQRLGPTHPYSLAQMELLAKAQVRAGQASLGAATLTQAMSLTIQTLGPNHPHAKARQALLGQWLNPASPGR
jgi:hypothetical protein